MIIIGSTIKKILYATDLSENSRLAFGHAASLAMQYRAEMIVLHVIEPINPNTYMQISGAMGESEWVNLQLDYENTMVDSLGTKLRRFCQNLEADIQDINIKDDNLLIRKGMSVDVILSTALEKDADIIVMGTHGYGMVKDALVGGTARRIVRRSDIPVLVVRSHDKE
jgi:nucleotide-binding universal stress UspA family protein